MGQNVELRIDEIAFGGRGVGRLADGRVMFVPFVAEGEIVRAEIVREHRSYVEGRLAAVTNPSPERVKPPCPYYGRCGGCHYQHLAHATQLEVKRRQVAGVLRRLGKIDAEVRPTVPSPKSYGYRNRITVHVGADGEIGFFAHDGAPSNGSDRGANRGRLVDIERCLLADEEVNAALTRLRLQPRPREGHRTLRAATASAEGFRQTNDGAAAALLELVAQLVTSAPGEPPPTHLVDAYCGAGFFGKRLRSIMANVIGLEWDARAVASARRGAAPHERYEHGDVAALLPAELAALPDRGAVLLVDPPSEGLSVEVRAAIARQPPETLVYVSCNPSTLARDLKHWRDVYCVESVTPLDMFPQTAEIEVVAHLRRTASPAGMLDAR